MRHLIGAGRAGGIVHFSRNIVCSFVRGNVVSDPMNRAVTGMGLAAKYGDHCEGKHEGEGQVPHCTRMSDDPLH